jgi:hypothetical protein
MLLALLGISVLASRVFGEPRPARPAGGLAEVVVLRGTGSDGAHLSLAVPVNLFAQLQQPGSGSNVNLSQIGGASVSSSLYDSGNTALKVNCVVGCSATGSFTDNSAFTTGLTAVTNISGLFNDAATLTSGNAGAIRATSDRMLYVNIGKIAGTVPSLTGSSLNVNCTGGCGGAATFADNSAFTAGTTSISNIGAVFNDGLAAVTSGNAAAPRITAQRGLHVNLRNNSGTEIGTTSAPVRVDPTGTTTQPVSGTVTANAGTGTFNVGGTVTANIGTSGALALDASVAGLSLTQGAATSGQKAVLVEGAVTTAAPTYTTGNSNPLSLNTSGGLRVEVASALPTGSNVIGALAANQSVNVAQMNGVAVTMNNGVAGTGVQRVAVASDNSNAPGIGGSATGSAVPSAARYIAGNADGNLTGAIFCNHWTAVNQTASTQIITGAASKQTYICNVFLFSATAQNINIVEGTGTTCATGTAGMLGGATAATGPNLAANQGFVLPASTVPWLKTATAADNVCLLQSGTGQVSGVIVWTQF